MGNRLKMTAIAVFMAAGVFWAGAQQPPANSPVARHGQLRVVGNQIVGAHGNPVQLRGMSLYWSIGGGVDFYRAGVVQHLRSDWRADVVRAAMAVERNFNNNDRGFIADPEGNRSRLLTVVNAAIEEGMYVIIDWHSYQAELNQQQAITFFQAMATEFRGVPNVLYEIYNEPNGSPGRPANQNGGVELPSNRNTPWFPTIRNYMQAVTDAIRAIDTANIILIGTPNWCQNPEVSTSPGNTINGKHLAYTAHFYAGQDASVHRGVLRNRIMTAMDRGFPIFVSEFGLTNASGTGTVDEVETTRWLDFLDFHHIGWANWSIAALGETSAAIQSGNGSNPSQWQLKSSGTYIRNRLRAAPATTMPFRILRVRDSESNDPNVEHHVSVTVGGTRSNDEGINTHVIDNNASVVLTAFPHFSNPPSWRFVRWEGDTQGLTRVDTSTITISMNANRTITAIFERLTSSAQHQAPGQAVRWSVARSGSSLVLTGPSAAEASLYNMRGKQVGRFTYDGSGRALAIGGQNMPAGRYMVVVRDIATGREVYKDRVMVTK
ncbi:MAG: cellulase family glycosylhydrolase [Chitinispirillales bacterium]|jgi:endoglucanase|nr:cellulase family glycosylhydrolase [Chitinispirillales bacterium]